MPTRLEGAIAQLAEQFARDVVQALRTASLADVSDYSTNGRRGARVAKKTRTPRLGWPKCPVCGKNAWPRGKGYCFEHSKGTGPKRRAKAKARAKAKGAKTAAPAKS
jgi:hypothetical protein